MNINKFTQASMQAIAECESLATKYGNQEIEQEHLLYALLNLDNSLIKNLIEKMEINVELCGGTHVSHTGEIQNFKIVSESGVAAGVRRIEAITASNVTAFYKNIEEQLQTAAGIVKSNPANLCDKLANMMKEIKALQSEVESLKAKAAQGALGDVMDQVVEVNGVKLLATKVSGVDMNALRDLGDQLKNKLGEGVIVLASDQDGKVNLIVMATDEAQKKGAHAGNLIKEC